MPFLFDNCELKQLDEDFMSFGVNIFKQTAFMSEVKKRQIQTLSKSE